MMMLFQVSNWTENKFISVRPNKPCVLYSLVERDTTRVHWMPGPRLPEMRAAAPSSREHCQMFCVERVVHW